MPAAEDAHVDQWKEEINDLLEGDQPSLVALSSLMRRVVVSIKATAMAPGLPVVIRGEPGTGKETVAHAVHRLRRQAQAATSSVDDDDAPRDLLAVNMAVLADPNLAHSTLFGHEPDSFTGAKRQHKGVFERVGQGTLFLDEIHHCSPPIQAMLLRVLESNDFVRLGGTDNLTFRGSIICATNLENPTEKLAADLWDRLNVLVIRLPPLSDRSEDLGPIVDEMLRELESSEHMRVVVPHNVREQLFRKIRTHGLQGNLRGLKTVIARGATRARLLTQGEVVTIQEAHIEGALERPPLASPAVGARSAEPEPEPESPAPPASADLPILDPDRLDELRAAYWALVAEAPSESPRALLGLLEGGGPLSLPTGWARLPDPDREDERDKALRLWVRVLAKACIADQDGDDSELHSRLKILMGGFRERYDLKIPSRDTIARLVGKRRKKDESGTEESRALSAFLNPDQRRAQGPSRVAAPVLELARMIEAARLTHEERGRAWAALDGILRANDPDTNRWEWKVHHALGRGFHEGRRWTRAGFHLRRALECSADDEETRRLFVRNVLEGPDDPAALADALEYLTPHLESEDPEWAGLWGRYHRQQWEQGSDPEARASLLRAGEAYGRAAASGHYPAVQSVIATVLGGVAPEPDALDRARASVTPTDDGADAWRVASVLEWALVTGMDLDAGVLAERIQTERRFIDLRKQRSMALGIARAAAAGALRGLRGPDQTRALVDELLNRLEVDDKTRTEALAQLTRLLDLSPIT